MVESCNDSQSFFLDIIGMSLHLTFCWAEQVKSQSVGRISINSLWGGFPSHIAVSKGVIQPIPVHKRKAKGVCFLWCIRGCGGVGVWGGCCKFISPRILNVSCAAKVFGVTLEHLMNFIWMSFSKSLQLRYCHF